MTSKFLLLMLLSVLVCTATASKRLLSQKGPFEDEKTLVPKRGLGGGGGNGNGGGASVTTENGANVVRGTGGGEFASMTGDTEGGGNNSGNNNSGDGNGNRNGNVNSDGDSNTVRGGAIALLVGLVVMELW